MVAVPHSRTLEPAPLVLFDVPVVPPDAEVDPEVVIETLEPDGSGLVGGTGRPLAPRGGGAGRDDALGPVAEVAAGAVAAALVGAVEVLVGLTVVDFAAGKATGCATSTPA